MTDSARIGFVTVSDRASKGAYEDRGGPAMQATLHDYLRSVWEPVARLIPDDQALIADTLRELAEQEGCCLILTTGGTGPSLRDVTPEATETVCDKMLPGFGELMRQESLKYVPTAILSRQTAGIYTGTDNNSLIINLPGKPSAIRECLDAIFPAVPYCIDLINGPRLETNTDVIIAFRPKSA